MRRTALLVLVVALSQIVAPAAMAKSKPSKLDAARASAKQIKAQLQAVTKRIDAQQAKSDAARQAAAAAAQRLSVARSEESAVTARLERVRTAARDVAVRLYMHAGPLAAPLAGDVDLADAGRADYYQRVALGSNTDLSDALRSALQDTEAARKSAEAAARLTATRKRAAGDVLDELRLSRDQQLRLAAAAESRVDAALKESVALSRRASRGSSPRGSISLTTVRGITVATQIADQLERMLSAASANGMTFGGSGYRSSDGQVAARRKNCGTSNYDVYDKPPGQCHPPTARPGQSMHEQGLAIDFTYNGSLIQSHSSVGYQWLRANAGRYGFYNLPSEAWHWSVNGN